MERGRGGISFGMDPSPPMAEMPIHHLPPPPPLLPEMDLPTTSTLPPLPSPSRPRLFLYYEDDPHRHFLDYCSLCRKSLPRNRDIFMYKGDMPFCSEECRQEQIDMDEAKERKWSDEGFGSKRKANKPKSKAEVVRVEAAGAIAAG